jgi:molecular chaperone HtpG
MNVSKPVLVSIKSDWNKIVEEPLVGKDVLELLSSAMYVNPLSIYREYVQNSTDSIEEAAALGLLSGPGTGRLEIAVDSQERRVRIRDNGAGIKKKEFVSTLVALGASRKRGSKARGFRGVGRLAGLGYCQELTFRSRADGETEVSELVWDCRRLRAFLRDSTFAGTVEDLIKDVVRTRRYIGLDLPDRFFEVELCGIVRHGDDSLVNREAIRDYLCQVAPIPFAPDFRFAKEIESALHGKVALGNVLIYLNGEKSPIYRPFRDTLEVRKGVKDRFEEVELIDLRGDGNNLVAVGWALHHGYYGAIDAKASIKGLRLRGGNIQVGECDVLNELFAEQRFNSWSVGEIHVIDSRILPNGRRDYFEQNVHFKDLLNRLVPLAKDLARRCRVSSLRRNAQRQYSAARERVNHSLSIASQGVLANADRKRLQKEASRDLKAMQKASRHSAFDPREAHRLQKDCDGITRKIEEVFGSVQEHQVLTSLKPRERVIYERFFSLIYECSANSQMAKHLVDKLLKKL